MENGFIKLYREIFDFEWYTEPLTVRLYIHLLIKANHKDTFHRGDKVERGQVFTGRKLLAKETGLTEQNVRTALSNLAKTDHLTIKSTSQRSIITLKNYNKFQDPNQQVTSDQPAPNQRLTTYNKPKKLNKLKEIKKPSKKIFFPDEELNDLFYSYIDHRKKLKKSMTDHAIDLAVKQIKKFSNDVKEQKLIIEQSILNGWIGLFELKQETKSKELETEWLRG